MKKILVIGCPGSGKSTFARELKQVTNLPLYYLDLIHHYPDKTCIPNVEFEEILKDIINKDSWIIDGNHLKTLEMRIKACDTIFCFDIPVNICLKSVQERIGKEREDVPWIENEITPKFYEFVKNFPNEKMPEIYILLNKYKDEKNIIILKDRKSKFKYLEEIKKNTFI